MTKRTSNRILTWLAVGGLALAAGCDEGTKDMDGAGNAGGKADGFGETDTGETDTGETDTGETDTAADGDEAWVAFLDAASDVERPFIEIPEGPRPVGLYDDPAVEGYDLLGPEFWERWPGGDTQEFDEDNASDNGLKCAFAAATRWEALHSSPPQAFADMRENQNWSGTYFNWIEDVSEGGSVAFATGWWAWRTGTMKFITVVHPDGTCELPTFELMRSAGEICGATGANDDGEIQGCRAQ